MDKKNAVYRKRSMVWRYRWKEEALAYLALLSFGFLINASVQIKGLFLDDLYVWYWFAEGPFMEYVFPIGSTRFRALYNFISYLEYFFVGNHMNWFVPINIIVNSMIAYTVYRMARRLSDSGLIGFVSAVLYLLSRMSYYQIGQVYGMMESLALWTAIALLYCLYYYLNNKESGEICYWAACGLYFANCFIHERYMVLVPLFYLTLLFRRERKLLKWLVPAALFLLVQLIRFLTIGTVLPAGTGGTFVAETFSARQTLYFIFQQVMHLFGVNLGGEWLCPQPWNQTALWVKLVVAAQDLTLLVVVLLFVVKIIKDRENRAAYLRSAALFIFFIGFCILSSSVTVRVEVRWVYVSMTAALLFLSYMCGVISKREKAGKAHFEKDVVHSGGVAVSVCLVLVYAALSFLSETYYRSYYTKLYFWYPQQEYNSLAEETWGKYGEDIFGKKIYILKNTYGVSRFNADTFFRTFDKERKAEGTEVIFADSIRDFGLVTNNMIILRENPEAHEYQDITTLVKELKCEPVYGYYEDGWMDENAKVRVMAGSTGRIDLELLYPGVMTGGETMTVRMDGKTAETFDIDQSILYVSLQAVPYQTVELEFENNFYLEDALEQRGEDRLSIIVNITAD